MEKAKNDIQFINEIYSRMLDFSNYCLNLNSSNETVKKLPVMFWKSIDEKRTFFIVFCMNQ